MYFYFYDTFVSDKKNEQLLGKIENRLIELGINGRTEKLTVLKNMKELERSKGKFPVTDANGQVTWVEAEQETHAALMIRNYWFGRHYGFIDPSW